MAQQPSRAGRTAAADHRRDHPDHLHRHGGSAPLPDIDKLLASLQADHPPGYVRPAQDEPGPRTKERTLAHPLVVHYRRARYDLYIGRGSKWGNPFVIGIHDTRDEVCDRYEQWLPDQSELIAALGELTEQTLGCSCAPKRCHGDFLAHLAARLAVPSPWGTTPRPTNGLTAAMAPF